MVKNLQLLLSFLVINLNLEINNFLLLVIILVKLFFDENPYNGTVLNDDVPLTCGYNVPSPGRIKPLCHGGWVRLFIGNPSYNYYCQQYSTLSQNVPQNYQQNDNVFWILIIILVVLIIVLIYNYYKYNLII